MFLWGRQSARGLRGRLAAAGIKKWRRSAQGPARKKWRQSRPHSGAMACQKNLAMILLSVGTWVRGYVGTRLFKLLWLRNYYDIGGCTSTWHLKPFPPGLRLHVIPSMCVWVTPLDKISCTHVYPVPYIPTYIISLYSFLRNNYLRKSYNRMNRNLESSEKRLIEEAVGEDLLPRAGDVLQLLYPRTHRY